jgi:transcription initiation factor IIE alpha subunit
MEEDNEWYVNHYHCDDCEVSWDDEHDCMCNDKCPECNAEIEPYESHQVDEDGTVLKKHDHTEGSTQ